MYRFEEANDKVSFDTFVEQNSSVFMQTSNWAVIKKTWKPYMFIGYGENDQTVLTALVLERSLPAVGSIWYSPSGFVADYSDTKLCKEFSAYIKSEMRKHNITAYIVDPQVPWQINGVSAAEAEPVIKSLKAAGYKYNPKRDDFTYQPPLTIGLNLKKDDGDEITADELLKRFEKGVRYSIRIGEQRGLVSEKYTYSELTANPELYRDFLSVMNDTSDRIGFITRPDDYYIEFMRELSDWAVMDLVYYDKISDKKRNSENFMRIKEIQEQLKTETKKSVVNKLKNEKESLDSQLKAFSQRQQETSREQSDKICVAAGITIRFGKEACCLFGGTRNIIRNNVRSSHYLNFIRIKDSIDRNMDFHDLGRVTYDYLDENSEHNGLYKFKKSFAADTVEYVGEYILVNKKFKYFAYSKFMPTAKKWAYNIKKVFKK